VSRPFLRTPGIVLRFALYAGIALVIAVVAGLFVVRADAISRARADVKSDAGFLADRLGRDDLARTAFLWPRGSDPAGQTALLDEFLDPQNAAKDTVRVTLLTSDGIVTYATDHKLIGRRLGHVPKGVRITHVAGKKVLETYAPVNWVQDPGRVRGFVGLARDYAPVAAATRRATLAEAGTLALALLLLYLAMLPIMHRLTARLRRALAERKRLAAIVETSTDAIVGRDREGRITSWNAGAEQLYGWQAGEVLGKTIDFLYPEATESGFDEFVYSVWARVVHVRKDGRLVHVLLAVSPIADDRDVVVGSSLIVRDVTAMVELEQELSDAQQQEAVARFAQAMAHELDGLVADLAPTDAGARGIELVQRLKAFDRNEPPKPEVLDVNRLIEGLRMRLELQLGSAIELELETSAHAAHVLADPKRLQRVVLDLALSARDAMPDGGRLVIRTQDVEFSPRAAGGLASYRPGQFLLLSVSDTAPVHHAERIGLGLATIYALVEQSGGTLGVDNRAGEGTTVRIYLPRAERDEIAHVA
jgi:PAS domain S-box-containing protein